MSQSRLFRDLPRYANSPNEEKGKSVNYRRIANVRNYDTAIYGAPNTFNYETPNPLNVSDSSGNFFLIKSFRLNGCQTRPRSSPSHISASSQKSRAFTRRVRSCQREMRRSQQSRGLKPPQSSDWRTAGLSVQQTAQSPSLWSIRGEFYHRAMRKVSVYPRAILEGQPTLIRGG